MKYIVKNCPAITNNLTCRQAIYENMFCDYRTDCVIKQVIEKCKEAINKYYPDYYDEGFEEDIVTDFANEILDMFDIEEINK